MSNIGIFMCLPVPRKFSSYSLFCWAKLKLINGSTLTEEGNTNRPVKSFKQDVDLTHLPKGLTGHKLCSEFTEISYFNWFFFQTIIY